MRGFLEGVSKEGVRIYEKLSFGQITQSSGLLGLRHSAYRIRAAAQHCPCQASPILRTPRIP